jgi:AAA15 family ATPase/GTPase
MAPLTVFFGSNSSGKSSIGHLLLLLKQTVDNSDRKTIIFSGNNTSPLQLGSLLDMIYHHDEKNKIEFEYLWDLTKSFQITDSKSEKDYSIDSIKFSASIGLRDRITSEVDYFQYDLINKEANELSINMKKIQGKPFYKIESLNYEFVRNAGRVWDISSPVRFYGFPDTVVAYYQNADFVQTLNLQHEKLFQSIYYLGPLRVKPQRL